VATRDGGQGVTLRQNPQGLEPLVSVEVRCPDCRGFGVTGALPDGGDRCRTCGGSGVVTASERMRDGREGETDD
jgi:DnaJ-class molecular chaperone